MKCSHCGKTIPDDSKLCINCGNKIQNEVVYQTNEGVYFSPQEAVQPQMFQQTNQNIKPNEPLKTNAPTSGLIGSTYHMKEYKGFNNYQEKLTTFIFASPFNKQGTMKLIIKTLELIGKVKAIDERRGFIQGKINYTSFQSAKVELYISQKDDFCSVRAVLHNNMLIKAKDIYWDYFLMNLFSISPGTDFGVTLCNGAPYLLAVKYLGSDTVIESSSVTSGGTSLTGFLIGDALFGAPGAIVGGMSGRQYTKGISKETFSRTQLVKIIYNNGRIYEGEVKKNSQLYNEIMVNM